LRKIKILLCGANENLIGFGTPAVIVGLMEGFNLNKDKIEYKKITYGRSIQKNNNLYRTLLEIIQLINYILQIYKYQPDIIHIQTGFHKKNLIRDNIYFLVSKFTKSNIVVHAHGGVWHQFPYFSKFFKKIVLFWLKNINCLIVTSQNEIEIIHKIFGGSVNVVKISNPIIMPNIKIERKEIINNKKIEVIYASRLIKDKGILDFLNALTIIKGNGFIVKIYGSGVLENKVNKIIYENNLDNKIKLMGLVPLNKLIEAYYKADIYIFPSYHLEGFPTSFFYALNCSMAVITTKVRPIPEFLVENKNCLWIPPKSPKVLAQKIDYLLKHKDLIEEMKKNNLTISQQFNISNIFPKFLNVYYKLLK